MLTIINKNLSIKRKNKRSAELLQVKLHKDNIASVVKKGKDDRYYIEVTKNIPSIFRLTLKDNKDFYINYKNICSSATKTVKLSKSDINEKNMDKIAQYILGQNPSLYTESISEDEIAIIREKIALEKQKKAQREHAIEERIRQQEEREAIRKANTLKEKSKNYVRTQTQKARNIILSKIKEIKSKI